MTKIQVLIESRWGAAEVRDHSEFKTGGRAKTLAMEQCTYCRKKRHWAQKCPERRVAALTTHK